MRRTAEVWWGPSVAVVSNQGQNSVCVLRHSLVFAGLHLGLILGLSIWPEKSWVSLLVKQIDPRTTAVSNLDLSIYKPGSHLTGPKAKKRLRVNVDPHPAAQTCHFCFLLLSLHIPLEGSRDLTKKNVRGPFTQDPIIWGRGEGFPLLLAPPPWFQAQLLGSWSQTHWLWPLTPCSSSALALSLCQIIHSGTLGWGWLHWGGVDCTPSAWHRAQHWVGA